MSCTTKIKHTNIVLKDGAGKSVMSFKNPNKRNIEKIIVDNCRIKTGKRCDFLLLDHNNVEYFIEMKGKEIKHACLQIEETIKILSSNLTLFKYSFIVSTACPLITSEIQILKAKFKKQYNSKLIIKNNYCEHTIS